MNFFEHQAAARRNSQRLVMLFMLAVIAIVLAVDLVVLLAIGSQQQPDLMLHGGIWPFLRANAPLLAVTSVVTVLVIGVASMVRIGSLRAGGSAVAESLGATRVDEDTRDPQLRRLRNVVEEIAIASSTPVPAIYVMEDEAGINAFAAGYSANDAAVAVTRGALERLNRDELQGVIAHEFSHILNGDTRLNIRLMGVLFGILVIGIAGRRVLMHSRGGRDSKNAAAIIAIALALMIIGYAGVFFGRMIKAGVSRSREYLADASAVQFTRQTTGIAGALKKIAGVDEGSKLAAAGAEEVSHMLFGDGIGYSSLWATHPPLLQRIRRLDPQFDERQVATLRQQWHQSPPSGLAEDRAMGLDGGPIAPSPVRAATSGAAAATVAVSARGLGGHVGQLEQASLAQAGRLHEQMPPGLVDAAHAADHAMPLLFALLVDANLREQQLAIVGRAFGVDVAGQVDRLLEPLGALHPLLRLPLASLAFPTLRRQPRPQLQRFIEVCSELIHTSRELGLFEYCLGRLLRAQVIEALDPSRHRPLGRRKLSQCREPLADLFSLLARHGHADDAEARRAFAAGMRQVLPTMNLDYRPPADWVGALDRAIAELDRLDATGKQLLVEGLATCSSHDGRITVAEAELLRTVCACLHCPLPPLLGAAG